MEKFIDLSEALKRTYSNEYHQKTLDKAKVQLDLINKFHPCTCKVEIYERDGGEFYLERTNFYLESDVCTMMINYQEYQKKYYIHFSEKFVNLDHYKISEITKRFKAPQNIGVLTTKKIQNWIKHEQDVYLALKQRDEELSNNVESFLETIKGEDVRWFNDNKSGEISKNGIIFKFEISNGYVSKKISIDYKVDNTLEAFKLLSDNKINREKKLKNILK